MESTFTTSLGPSLAPVLGDAFWTRALEQAGAKPGRVVRRWRNERYEYALIEIDERRWLGKALLGDDARATPPGPDALRSATEAALLGRLSPERMELGVLVPALLAHGTLDGHAFLIRQWINARATTCTEEELAHVCERLRHYDTRPLPRDFADQWHGGRRPGINRRIEIVSGWAEEMASEFDAKKLLAIVRDPPGGIQQAFSHGDLVPANFLRNDEGLWLIDFEEASAKRAEFFDAAFCYFVLRVLPRALFPGRFLMHFQNRLGRSERHGFRQALRWHLAALVIGAHHDRFAGQTRIPRLNLDLLAADIIAKRLA
jgi:hypothetical protein